MLQHVLVGFPSINGHRSERFCCIFVIYLFFPNFQAAYEFTTAPSQFPRFRGKENWPRALLYVQQLRPDFSEAASSKR